jgi:hypothetical protein
MRSVKGSFLLGVLLVIMMPAPAHAWFGWLDNLSGPGPFVGDEIEIRLACFFGDGGGPSRVIPIVVETGCLKGKSSHHRLSIDLIAGWYLAIANKNIPYTDPNVNRRTGLINYGAVLSYSTKDQRIELKGGLERNYFYGPAFDNFTRLSVVSFIDWKPFSYAKEDSNEKNWRDIVTLRLGALLFPSGFDSTDFGATQGAFHTNHDFIKFVGLVFDFGARK